MAYAFFGVPDRAAPDAGDKIADNGVRYQDEIILSAAFNVACAATLLDSVKALAGADAATRTQAQRDTVKMMRQGADMTLRGFLMMQSDRQIRDANRVLLLDAILRYAGIYSESLTPELRLEQVKAIDEVAATASPATRPKLQQLKTSMSRTDCVGLCAV